MRRRLLKLFTFYAALFNCVLAAIFARIKMYFYAVFSGAVCDNISEAMKPRFALLSERLKPLRVIKIHTRVV